MEAYLTLLHTVPLRTKSRVPTWAGVRYNIVPRTARQHSSRCWRVPYFVPGDGIDARGLQLTSAFAQTLPCCHQRRPTRLHWPCETSWSWGTTCTVIPTVPVLHSYRLSTTVLGKGARAWGPAAWGGLAGGRRWLSLPSCSYPSHDDDRSNTLPAPRSGQPAQTIFTSSGHRRHAISSHPQTCVSLACWPKSLGLRNNITSPRPPQPPTGAKNQYGYGTVQCCIHSRYEGRTEGTTKHSITPHSTSPAGWRRLACACTTLLCHARSGPDSPALHASPPSLFDPDLAQHGGLCPQ